MRKIIAFLAALTLPLIYSQAGSRDAVPSDESLESLSSMNHPRLLAGRKEFRGYVRAVNAPRSEALASLHAAQMRAADGYARETSHAVYRKDLSGRRILSVSRFTLERLFALSYAFRFTSDKVYLRRAESLLADVCSFPDWNPSHFLDTAEMSVAVAIAYDWLYDALSPSVREMAARTLLDYALTGKDKLRYINTLNNWNEVCNAGVICASIAVCDLYPEVAAERIRESLESNSKVMDIMYAPDGVYPEGPGYWEYGTQFEILLITALRQAFGTDFGLSGKPGFSRTGRYILWSESGLGLHYNFYDNGEAAFLNGSQWFFADIEKDNGLLFHELQRHSSASLSSMISRLNPLYLLYAAKYDGSPIEAPRGKLYHGGGNTPVVIARDGWDRNNSYLALKGGMGASAHGHLDAGSFVYDAYGYRWASELIRPSYTVSEYGLAPYKASLWSNKPLSWRWRICAYNNRFHNTLTVNNHDHKPSGMARISEVIDRDGAQGAAVDLTEALDMDLETAVRTTVLLDGGTLSVTDSLMAGNEGPAFVRWTLVTPSSVEILDDCILLRQGDVTMKLQAAGVPVRYMLFPSKPDPSENPVADFDPGTSDTVCGFTFRIARGATVCVHTTMSRVSRHDAS